MSVPFAGSHPLPLEILENIAFELVASSPLGNPKHLVPLLATSRAVHNALSMKNGTALYSRICQLMFDVGAVTRRAFTPRARDLNGHLVQMCTMLKFFASGDIYHEDASDQLLIAYVAMLENDGKNRAQLEHVGIVNFVDRFVRQRLHEGKESNDGWPLDTDGRVYALWLMWFLATRERLLAETEAERSEILRLVFPFLVCPNRYPSAIAPPNHFTLPLGPDSTTQNHIFVVDTAHGSYPVYHTARKACDRLYHYSAQPVFMEPLMAPAASLLFWSRRELNGVFQVPPHLPQDRAARQGQPGLTQSDLHEFNATRIAQLPERVVWDWDSGTAVKVADDGTALPSWEHSSARFDIDWWRSRLCTGFLTKQPKFRLGSVYLRGIMTGLWQGIMFGQSHTSFMDILNHRQCSPNLSEHTTHFTSKPLWLRLAEHGYVRTPGSNATTIPEAPAEEVPITVTTEHGTSPAFVPLNVSLGNAWFPGPVGSLRWLKGGEPLNDGVFQDRFLNSCQSGSNMDTTEFIVSPHSPFAPNHTGVMLASEYGGPVDKASATLAVGDRFIYEHYEHGLTSVHQRMVEAQDNLKSSSSGHKAHRGCLKCREIESFLIDRRAKEREREVPHMSDDEVDAIFETVGMRKVSGSATLFDDDPLDEGQPEAQHVLDLGLHFQPNRHPSRDSTLDPQDDSDYEDEDGVFEDAGQGLHYDEDEVRPAYDQDRVERCDGVEDVVLTGDLDEHHRLAWGETIYYGRIRPWDGMVAILALSRDRISGFNNHTIYYGYIYGGEVFVGNWRYATMDPLVPNIECGFIMSKKTETSVTS